jgi:hypothetical protein
MSDLTGARWRCGRLRWWGKSATPWEASLRWVGAPGPTHEDERRVRRLGTDGAVETEVRHDRGGLPEGGSGGGADKRMGGVFFYCRTLRGGNAGLCKEGEREVTARRSGRATRVHMHAAIRSSDVTVAAALRGEDVDGVFPYAIGTGELARGWRWTGPRGKRACASTPCLRGMSLGSWRDRRGRMQCQRGRRKQRRCAGPCHWVLGAGITAASSGVD